MRNFKENLYRDDSSSKLPAESWRQSGGPTPLLSNDERIVPLAAWIIPFAGIGALVWALLISKLWAWLG